MSRVALLAGLAALVAVMWGLSFASRRLEAVAAGVAPLEPRRFDRLTAVAAGTGGTFENHLRLGPTVAVGLGDTVVLVDAGRATAQALRRAKVPVTQPRVVLLTSLLPENVVGVDDWWAGAALEEAPPEPLRVVGPPGTRALVEGLRAAHAAGVAASSASFGRGAPALEGVEVEGGHALDVGTLSARAFAQRGGPLPALAWRLEGGGRAATVSSAGWDPEALVEAARGADLWLHEALYGASLEAARGAGLSEAAAREAALHTRLEEVGALATRAGARRLALLRLRPPPVYDVQYRRVLGRSYRGAVDIAADGDELTP